jgi:hypothetical protein
LELFRQLNKEFFDNKLPHVRVEWDTKKERVPGTLIARCKWRGPKGGKPEQYKAYLLQIKSELRPRYLQKQVGMSMLHEMVHLKLGVGVECEDWDGDFDKEMFKLAAAGAFQWFW